MEATAIMVTEAVGWTLGIPGALCGAIGSEKLTLADSVRFFSFLFFSFFHLHLRKELPKWMHIC